MKTSPLLTVWRAAAAFHALVIVVLSLLPGEQLRAWAPLAHDDGFDATVGAAVVPLAVAFALVLLAALVVSAACRMRIRIGPRLRLSWPLFLVLIAYTVGLALVVSGDLRAAVQDLALERVPAWLDLATGRLAAGHTLAYAGLGLLLVLGWGRQVALWRLGLLAFALSGVVEAMQELVPERTPSRWDVLANGLGLAVGLTAGGLLIGRPWSVAFRSRPGSGPGEEKGPPERARELTRV